RARPMSKQRVRTPRRSPIRDAHRDSVKRRSQYGVAADDAEAEHPLLVMQRLVGNRAVTRLLERSGDGDAQNEPPILRQPARSPVIQRGVLSWLKKKFSRKSKKKTPEPTAPPKETVEQLPVKDQKPVDDKLETIEPEQTPPPKPEHPPE